MARDGDGNQAAKRDARKAVLPAAIGWIAFLALLGWVGFLHQGLGSPPGGWASEWWHPTQFLLLTPTVGGWSDVPLFGTTVLSLPSLLLVSLVYLGTRSAILRTIGLAAAVSGVVFCLTAFSASGPWELFHWRLSVVILLVGLAIGSAIMSPALAEAWLRRGPLAKLLLYVPLAFAVIALMRNATGTDETLPANFSPWPVITVFGLEMGAYTTVGVLFGLAIGLGGLTQWGRRPLIVLVGVLVGCVFPAIWFQQRFSNTEPGALVGMAVLAAVGLALASITRHGDRSTRLAHRGALFALGAFLVLIPLFAGRAWAAADYTINKFVRARTMSNALAEYYAKEGEYPERLETLVEQSYLDVLPRPRVGFDFLYDVGMLPPLAFSYRGLGSSYVLEFNSTEWVQCAYNPPWAPGAGGEYEEEEYEDEYDDESGEAWSCPDTRPALWGNEEEGGDEYPEEYDEYEDEYEEE